MILRGPWRAHLVLLILLLAQALAAWALHRDRGELLEAWHSGTAQERLAALHVLTNRGQATGFGQDFSREMLADPDPLIREAAMTLDLCKFDLPMIQEAYLGARDFAAAASGRDGLNDAGLGQHPPGQPPTAELAHWWRAYFLHRRKVGGYVVGSGVRPRLREVRWFLEAREERPLPRDEIQEHILAIQAKALRFKGTAGKTR